jgi:hypothetical protein
LSNAKPTINASRDFMGFAPLNPSYALLAADIETDFAVRKHS